MRDFIERVGLVLNWRSRSIWMLVGFTLATIFFGFVATGALERLQELKGTFGNSFYIAFQPIFKNVFIFFIIMSVIIPTGVFIKDWEAFHRRW